MENKQKYLEFIKKRRAMFMDEKTACRQSEDTSFADEAFALGIEMDCGKSFCEKYNVALGKNDTFDFVDDIDCLASAIFSYWRYFNHWAEYDNIGNHRDWFIKAFTRLEELVEKTE